MPCWQYVCSNSFLLPSHSVGMFSPLTKSRCPPSCALC
jgi:hypothetical protein